jgi:hypothetical protein
MLLEVKSHARLAAAVTEFQRPFVFHWAESWTRLPARNQPVDSRKVDVVERLSRVKPLDLAKPRRDMHIVMDEIDRSGGVLGDAYSPIMWQRLQSTTERVANAIHAVRLKLVE